MYFTLLAFVIATYADKPPAIAIGKIAYESKKECEKNIPDMVKLIDEAVLDITKSKPIYKEKLCITQEQVKERVKGMQKIRSKEKEDNSI